MEEETGLDETLNRQGGEDTSEPQGEVSPRAEEPKAEEKDYKSLYENQRVRAEKVEKELKELRTKEPQEKYELSQKDVLFLAKADVHEDDLDDIIDYASLKKISLSEALSSGIIKSLLTDNREKRKTAEASSTSSNRSGVKGKDGGDLLREAQSGKLPTSQEEMEALIEARFQSKSNK